MAVDSVAVVTVVPAESAIAGKRFTRSNTRKGAMKAWHPFSCAPTQFRDVPCLGHVSIAVRGAMIVEGQGD